MIKERKNVALASGGTLLKESVKRNTESVKERTRKDDEKRYNHNTI